MIRSKSPILVFVGLILIVCNGCEETQEKHFANLAAAQQEHMVDKGWIPTYVSPDAKDISIEGDLDAATVNGSYTSGMHRYFECIAQVLKTRFESQDTGRSGLAMM
jgi:hypothetical protein